MILFSKDLLFVHNPKTAGTSLIEHFRTVLPGPVHTAGVHELGTHHPHLEPALEHARRSLGGGAAAPRCIVAVLRRPLERERSMYAYYRNVLSGSPSLLEDLPDPTQLQAVGMAEKLTFAGWLEWQDESFGHCDLWNSRLYYEYGDHACPESLRIVRFESLDRDLQAVMRELGVTAPPPPHLNATSGGLDALDPGPRGKTLIDASYAWIERLPPSRFVWT